MTISVVLTCRFMVVSEHFTQNEFVGVFPERVSKHGLGHEVHITVGAFSLVSA